MKNGEWLKEWVEDYMDRANETLSEDDTDLWTTVRLNGGLSVLDELLRKIDQLGEPETLSEEWIDEHSFDGCELEGTLDDDAEAFVSSYDLQNLLVPKQEEVDKAYKDGYEKGKEHAGGKEAEETETVASVMADFFGAAARLKEVLAMEVEELEE